MISDCLLDKMGDNERKENPVQEEGDRNSLAPNAVTADEVGTEVRDALLALTAEVKVITEQMGSLETSQQRVWHCMQENAGGQDQLMGYAGVGAKAGKLSATTEEVPGCPRWPTG